MKTCIGLVSSPASIIGEHICLVQKAFPVNRPFEHEECLRELCLKQQEINKLLDLDKGDAQAVANDNMPQDEQAADCFVEQLAAGKNKGRIGEPAA